MSRTEDLKELYRRKHLLNSMYDSEASIEEVNALKRLIWELELSLGMKKSMLRSEDVNYII